MPSNASITGISMTRFGKFFTRPLKDLVEEAVHGALSDAGLEKNDIDAVFFGNCVQGHMEGQDMIRGEVALRPMGFEKLPIFNVENACATASTAFHLACNYVSSGSADVVLAVGAEKMISKNKKLMFEAFDGAWDVHAAESNRKTFEDMSPLNSIKGNSLNSERKSSVFMEVYAGWSRKHMESFGTTRRQLAAVASKNHINSVANPKSQYRKSFSIEEVLSSQMVAYPLTLPMCSPISDGAAAAIICNKNGLKKIKSPIKRAILVRSSVIQTGSNRDILDVENHITKLAAKKAYECGIGPEDLDVVEVHDATAIGEIIEIEALGICEPGQGGISTEKGMTSMLGSVPVNPSGGLESKGHPIGATGLGQIYELVLQLRGEAGPRQIDSPKVALSQNGGGVYGIEEAVSAITLLSI
ncbi:MAG: thiolase family protein [Pseudomonadota bacterium]|nr:thiolase family protein [Pseudomonadota bacterium]